MRRISSLFLAAWMAVGLVGFVGCDSEEAPVQEKEEEAAAPAEEPEAEGSGAKEEESEEAATE